MFGGQTQQIAALVPAKTARDIVACLANQSPVLRHNGPIGVFTERGYAPKAFRRPPGRKLHYSKTGSGPAMRASPKPPLWKDLPGRPQEAKQWQCALTVPGACRFGEAQADTLEANEVRSGVVTVSEGLTNDGVLTQAGPASMDGPVTLKDRVEILGDVFVDQSATLLGPVFNNNVVNNLGPVFNNGPVFHFGPVVFNGREMVLTPVEVVTDVLFSAGTLYKTVRTIMAAAPPGPETMNVIFDCG